MAALFQIRRGSGSVDLAAGELYDNQTLRTLELGVLDSSSITLVKLDEQNSGSLDITGDLIVSGSARIIGNLTFGDSDSMDTVTIVASLSSSLIPETDGVFNIGSTGSRWNKINANEISASLGFSGSVNGIDITALNSRVTSLEGFTASVANTNQHTQSINSFTASITESFNTTSGSLNVVSQSLVNTLTSYIATSQSFDIVSSSLLTFSSSQYKDDSSSFDLRLDSIETYTSSLKTAIAVDGQDVTIYGNITVQGTQTSLNTTETFIEDLTLTIASGSTNSSTANGAGLQIAGADVTMSWSDANQRIELNKDFAVTGSISASSVVGIGNVTSYSTSVDARLDIVEATASLYIPYSQSVDARLDIVETTASLYVPFSTSVDNRLNLLESTTQSLNTYTASVSTSVGLLQQFSGSEYKNESASFDTRISASTLTYNDTTGQTGIDFTKVGTELSAIASGLTTTSNVQFASITASYVSASGTIYCDTLVADTLVGATLPVLEYETNGTLGNILIKGATSKSIQVVDTITFEGLTQNGTDQYSATGLLMTGSITASLGFSGSINGIGNITEYSTSVDSRLDTIESKYATTGSNNFVGNQTITGSLFVSASNIELKRDWPEVGPESHFLRLAPFTSSTNRYYDGLSIGVEHWDDGTGTYEHSLLIHSFDDDTNPNYGAELNVGPYRTHMRVYPSGSNNKWANVSVQELSNGKSQTAVYGEYVQIGAYVGDYITIGNTGSFTNISGSLIVNNITGSFTGSVFGIGNVSEFSASVDSRIINNQPIGYLTTSSFTAFSTSVTSRVNVIETTFATTGSNTFIGTQTITGSLFISSDLIVQGSSSLQNITASAVSIGTNIVNLNTANPAIRYTGLVMVDSGSIGGSGSFLYDSVQDEMIFVHRGASTTVTSSVVLMGPQTYDSIGNESYLTANRITKGTGNEHLVDSNISDDGTTVSISTNFDVTGSQTFDSFTILSNVGQNLNFANDAAAASGGVPLYGLYRSGNFIMIRLT